MKKTEKVSLKLEEECFIESHFVENENVGMYGLYWTIDFINAVSDIEPELILEINLDSTHFEIKNWTCLDTIKLNDDIPLFYDTGDGSCMEVEEPEVIISERINDKFRVQIKGIIERSQLLHHLYDNLDDLEDIEFSLDTIMKFKGITISKEFLNNKSSKEFLSYFFQTDNLIISEHESYFFFEPKF